METFNYLVLRRLNIGTKLHQSGDTAASLGLPHHSCFTFYSSPLSLTVDSLPACQIVLSEVPPAERGVGGQHHDEGQQPVEHAEDGGAALAGVPLGT